MAPIKFADAIADPLQKAPVVGDEHDGALKCSDLLLQPVDGGDIEVVGWLIKEQDVGLDHQRSGERRAPTPSSREGRKLFVGIQIQLLQYLFDPLRHGPAVEMLQLGLNLAQLLQRVGRAICRQRVVSREQGASLG